MDANEVKDVLNKQSGLLGVSGITATCGTLLEKSRTRCAARDAVEFFCYRAKKYIGAYAAALGGLDLLVFTGGIGEHAPRPFARKSATAWDFSASSWTAQRTNQTRA